MFSAPDWKDGQLKTQFGYLPETSAVYSTKELPYKSPFSEPRATPSEGRGVEESPEVLPTRTPRLEADESRKATDIVPRTRNTRRLKYHAKSRNGCRTCRSVRCGSFSASLFVFIADNMSTSNRASPLSQASQLGPKSYPFSSTSTESYS
jgi:hypothetical protein